MKKIIFMLLLFVSFMEQSKAYINADCVSSEECLVLCNYKTSFDDNKARNITIYYNFDSKDITVKWQHISADAYVATKGPGAVDYIFSNSGTNIYWGINSAPTLSNFVCPKNGYLDTSELNSNNELCFDNDGVTCKNNYSNAGTAFGKDNKFKAQKKDYDIEEQIAAYSNWIFGDIKEEISSGKFNVEADLEDKIHKDFRQNFLYNNDIPEFIINSPAFIELEKNVLKEFNKAKEEEIEKSEEALENGEITEEEHQQTVENWDVEPEIVYDAFANIKLNFTPLADFNVSDYCTSYLGNPESKGQPAYYLQFIFDLMKYAAIILLFVFSVVDFGKAIVSSNQDALKKALLSALKRLIIVVLIFFLPSLIKFLLTILGAYSPGTCGIG